MILNANPFPWLHVAIWFALGSVVIAFAWVSTRPVPVPWIRALISSFIIAVTFTPVTIQGLGNPLQLTMPAWAAFYALAVEQELNIIYLLMVFVPVAGATLVLWALGMQIQWTLQLLKKKPFA